MCDTCMTPCTISGDMVPARHADYVRQRAYRPWNDVELLEITPEWVYGAFPSDELIYTSNNFAARVELSAYSDGMGGNCADHIVVERGMLSVPLWRDDESGPSSGYHPAAIVGLSLLARMDDYLILDEDDHSERESLAWIECLTDEFRWADDGEREREDSAIDSHLTRFIAYCWEHIVGYYSVYGVPAEDIERAYAVTKEETINA